MRPTILAAVVMMFAAALPGMAAAQSSFLDGLFGTPAHHVAHKAKAKTSKPADTTPAAPNADEAAAPPIPLPRPRPAAEATPVPLPRESPKDTPTPAPIVPATPAPTAAAPASTEGESTTPKPPRIYQTACPAVISGLVVATPLPPISEGECGAASPMSVTKIMVNGRLLPLSAPATFTCEMATDLPAWVADVDNYIWSAQNTRIKSIEVGESYVCRPRNTPEGSSDLSEHGRADALDFVGFTLDDGRKLTVTDDYASSDPKISRLMHFAHDAACTRFTTVLGPDANSLHHDHFHLDLGCHGKTCTYRLCE